MADLIAMKPMTDSAYEAMADQLLRDMRSLNEKIEREYAETQRIKAESKRIRDDYRRLGEENRALIARLEKAF
jgi:hypothetical protein